MANEEGVGSDVSDLETIIATMRSVVEGEVCTRSRVLDALLDLRLEAEGRPDVIELVDAALTELPGRTMVPSAWWLERLDLIGLAVVQPSEPVA